MSFSRSISVLVLATTLAACGGNGGGGSPEVNVTAPSDNSSRSSKSGLLVVSGKAASGSTVEVTFPDGSKKSILVGSSGTYSLSSEVLLIEHRLVPQQIQLPRHQIQVLQQYRVKPKLAQRSR